MKWLAFVGKLLIRERDDESVGGSNSVHIHISDVAPAAANEYVSDSEDGQSAWSGASDDSSAVLGRGIPIRKNGHMILKDRGRTHGPVDCPWVVFPCILCCKQDRIRWMMGSHLIYHVTYGVLQYVVVECLLTPAVLVAQLTGWYEEGVMENMWAHGWVYSLLITGCSQVYAIHCLIYFYRAAHFALEPHHPLAKFAAIKLVIFASWWQEVALTILEELNLLPWREQWQQWGDIAGESGATVAADMLQDMLICAEMFLLAICHQWIFSYHEFAVQTPKRSFIDAAKDLSDIRGVAREIRSGFCTCADGSATEQPQKFEVPMQTGGQNPSEI